MRKVTLILKFSTYYLRKMTKQITKERKGKMYGKTSEFI